MDTCRCPTWTRSTAPDGAPVVVLAPADLADDTLAHVAPPADLVDDTPAMIASVWDHPPLDIK